MDNEKTNCPVCGVSLNKVNLDRHTRKVHGHSNSATPRSEKPGPASYDRVMYQCKQCKKLFGKSATKNHMQIAHDYMPDNIEECHKYFFDETVRRVKRNSTSKQSAKMGQPKPKQKETVKGNLKQLQQASRDVRLHRRLWHEQNRFSDQCISKKEWREKFESTLFHCKICSKDIALRNIRRHYKKAHHWDIQKGVERKAPSPEGLAHESDQLKEGRASQNEYFNRFLVMSAGAYGMGKKR